MGREDVTVFVMALAGMISTLVRLATVELCLLFGRIDEGNKNCFRNFLTFNAKNKTVHTYVFKKKEETENIHDVFF